MNKNISRLFSILMVAVSLSASSASAELGLAQMLANPSQGVPAVEQAVLAAIQAAYAGTTDATALQVKLIAILNEVAATGNESAIRYAIIAVMGLGGVSGIDASKAAIDNSRVAAGYGELVATTVAEAESLMRAAAGGGGGGQSGGQSGGGQVDPVIEGIFTEIIGGAKGQPGTGATPT